MILRNTNNLRKNDRCKSWCNIFFLIFLMNFSEINLVLAADTPIGETLCTTAGWMSGPLGTAIEILALIILGILALFGKVSWGMALIDAVGVVAVFAAADIVDSLGGDASGCT